MICAKPILYVYRQQLQDLSISWPDDMESDKQEQWVGGFNEVKGVLSRLQTLWILIYADPVPLLELLYHCTGLKKLVITTHHVCMFLNIPRSFNGKFLPKYGFVLKKSSNSNNS